MKGTIKTGDVQTVEFSTMPIKGGKKEISFSGASSFPQEDFM